MSNYTKTNPKITYTDFLQQVKQRPIFTSLTGRKYEVMGYEGNVMVLKRLSTDKIWRMDLDAVHKAYIHAEISGVKDFMPYLKRTKSPALGLLLTLGLLK